MSVETISRASAVARLGFGGALIARPQALTRPWIGRDAGRAGPQVLARALGIRDLALGAGTLAAAGGDRRRWLMAAVACDAVDLVATLAAGRGLPLRGRVIVSAAATSGVAMGVAGLIAR